MNASLKQRIAPPISPIRLSTIPMRKKHKAASRGLSPSTPANLAEQTYNALLYRWSVVCFTIRTPFTLTIYIENDESERSKNHLYKIAWIA